MTGDIKIWLTVTIVRDDAGNPQVYRYRWRGTDGLDYSPEFDDYRSAVDYPQTHTLKPIQ